MPFTANRNTRTSRATRATRAVLATVIGGGVALTSLLAPAPAAFAAGASPSARVAESAANIVAASVTSRDAVLNDAANVLAAAQASIDENSSKVDVTDLKDSTERLGMYHALAVSSVKMLADETRTATDAVNSAAAEYDRVKAEEEAARKAEEARKAAEAEAQRAQQAAAAANTQTAASERPSGVTDVTGARAIGRDLAAARGWGDDEFQCLDLLWARESGWNVNAYNASSGATGIPQALPGSKMASAGSDWATNPATQITWGLGYIGSRYGSPCGAWAHSEANGWY